MRTPEFGRSSSSGVNIIMKTDEIVDLGEKLTALNNAQKARTYEFVIAYNTWTINNNQRDNTFFKGSVEQFQQQTSNWCTGFGKGTKAIIRTNPLIKLKYDRMIQAKKKFESAGGEYEIKRITS